MDLSEFPPSLRRLMAELVDLVDRLTEGLEAGLSGEEWQREMERLLTRYHMAAYMTGQESADLGPQELSTVRRTVQSQLAFLDNFSLVIQTDEAFERGWRARAEMYAEGVQQSYWSGRTKVLPLPAMPGDGTTQCFTRCRCKWDVMALDEAAGDYDAYWRLGTADHCQTCTVRAGQWAPLQIRGGSLLL